MKAIFIVFIVFFGLAPGIQAQEIRKISKLDLSEILKNPSDKLHVVNFWATWCGPCVKELPDFQKVVNEADNQKVDFLFISLDFPSDAEKKLVRF